MTVRQFAKNRLRGKGLTAGQVVTAMRRAEGSTRLASMQGRWDDPVSDYPRPMFIILSTSLDTIASEVASGKV